MPRRIIRAGPPNAPMVVTGANGERGKGRIRPSLCAFDTKNVPTERRPRRPPPTSYKQVTCWRDSVFVGLVWDLPHRDALGLLNGARG